MTPVIGRDGELARLDALLARVRDGDGAALLLTGEAGVGKTRLVTELATAADRSDARLLRAVGFEAERGFELAAVRELLAPAATALGVEATGRLDAATRPGRDAAERPPAPADAYVAFDALAALLREAATERPTLLCLDDAQWADAVSLRFLAYLARRLDAIPVGLVVATREDRRRCAEELRATLPRLELAPLAAADSAELTRRQLGARADDALCAACHRASGGNAFLLTTLLERLGEGTPPAPAAIETLALDDVARSAERRLAALGPQAAAVARALAVLGSAADIAALAQVAELPTAAVSGAVDALLEARLARVDGDQVDFRHPLLRAAVADAVPLGAAALQHTRAADLLIARGAPAETIAHHLLHAPPAGRADVVDLLHAAAARAAAWGDAERAAALLRRALAEPPPQALRATLLAQLAAASVRLEGPAAAGMFGAALAATDDRRERVRIGIAKGRLLIEHSAPAAAVAAFDAARAQLPGDDDELRVELEVANAELLMSPAHAAAASAQLVAATERLEPRDDRARELLAMRAYRELGVGAVDRAAALVAPLIERPASVLTIGEMAFESVVVTQVIAEQLDAAERWLIDGRALARAEGAGRPYRACVLCLGFLAVKRGELPAAERLLREALTLHEELSWQRTFALCLLIDGLGQQGRWEEADALFAGWRRPETPYPIMLMPLAGHAASLVARGQTAQGVAQLEELFPLLSWQEILPVHRELALGLAALGRREEAVALARERVARARRGPEGPAKLGAALRVLAAVDAEADAIALLRESVAALAPSYTRLEHARALCDLGAALRRAGRRAHAREPLREALAIARPRGAEPLVRRAEEELTATGARVRRGPSADRDALTPSEARIARRAADGRTNREIAADLGVLPKTVEVHLTNVYRKLGIRSRDELAAALAAAG